MSLIPIAVACRTIEMLSCTAYALVSCIALDAFAQRQRVWHASPAVGVCVHNGAVASKNYGLMYVVAYYGPCWCTIAGVDGRDEVSGLSVNHASTDY